MLCSSFIFRAYSISQGMSRVCPFPNLALLWPFANFLMARWLEIDHHGFFVVSIYPKSGPHVGKYMPYMDIPFGYD